MGTEPNRHDKAASPSVVVVVVVVVVRSRDLTHKFILAR